MPGCSLGELSLTAAASGLVKHVGDTVILRAAGVVAATCCCDGPARCVLVCAVVVFQLCVGRARVPILNCPTSPQPLHGPLWTTSDFAFNAFDPHMAQKVARPQRQPRVVGMQQRVTSWVWRTWTWTRCSAMTTRTLVGVWVRFSQRLPRRLPPPPRSRGWGQVLRAWGRVIHRRTKVLTPPPTHRWHHTTTVPPTRPHLPPQLHPPPHLPQQRHPTRQTRLVPRWRWMNSVCRWCQIHRPPVCQPHEPPPRLARPLPPCSLPNHMDAGRGGAKGLLRHRRHRRRRLEWTPEVVRHPLRRRPDVRLRRLYPTHVSFSRRRLLHQATHAPSTRACCRLSHPTDSTLALTRRRVLPTS